MKQTVSRCPIGEAMLVLSGRWPTLLLYYLKDGTKRFSELRRDNPAVSHRMLTLELRKLEAAGIVRRTVHDGYPLRVEYSLSQAGLKLVPLIDALGDWWEETADGIGHDTTDAVAGQILAGQALRMAEGFGREPGDAEGHDAPVLRLRSGS